MTRFVAERRAVVVELFDGPVPMFHVNKYGRYRDLWLFWSPDDRAWHTVLPVRGIRGCRFEGRAPDGWPPVDTIIADVFPVLFGGRP